MKTIAALTLLAISLLLVPTSQADIIEAFGTGTNAFTMTFVPIGNPGNAPDTTGAPNPAGSVGYHYRMGKYEVSRDLINKANVEGGLGITMEDMTLYGGNGPNRPATGVSWNGAARYVNWLNTSKGYSPAYKFDIQPGQPGYSASANITLWQASDPGYNAGNPFRNSMAKYFLPSVDEWYKAAYYDPNANGGAGGYWKYATGNNTPPIPVPFGNGAGTAVYNQSSNQGPSDVVNAGGLSPYGLMAMNGNIWEWEETESGFVLPWEETEQGFHSDIVNDNPSSFRFVKGGGWGPGDSYFLASDYLLDEHPSAIGFIGFRVASIPEPSSAVLLMLASVGLLHRRNRTR